MTPNGARPAVAGVALAAAGLVAAVAMVALPVSAPASPGHVVPVSCGPALTVALEGSPPPAPGEGPLAERRRGDCAEQAVRRVGWAGLVLAAAVVPAAAGGVVASGRARRRQRQEAGGG